MRQTLKATAALVGAIICGVLCDVALNVPLVDKATEILTAITAIFGALAAVVLTGYAAAQIARLKR